MACATSLDACELGGRWPLRLKRGNCTRSSVSASPFENNDLRISALSLAAPQRRDPGINLYDLAAVDARLARLCAAWASLPEYVILAILALVDSAGVVQADRLQPPSPDSPRGRPPAGHLPVVPARQPPGKPPPPPPGAAPHPG